jgi:hypothetical protein
LGACTAVKLASYRLRKLVACAARKLTTESLACIEQLDPVPTDLQSTTTEVDSGTESTSTPYRITHLPEASIVARAGASSSGLVDE